MKGEEVIFTTKLHWWVIFGAALNSFIVVLLFGLCIMSGSTRSTSGGGIVVLALIASAIAAFGGYINYNSSEFGLTNRRVLIKTGLIRRQTLELNLNKIESFQVQESLLGRILGYKNLRLTGSGGTKQRFTAVANADTFRKRVVEMSTD